MGTTVRRATAACTVACTAAMWAVAWATLLGACVGCQPSRAEMSHRLVARMSLIDFTGLAPAKPVSGVGVSAAIPRAWEVLPAQSKALFTHRQWRSPTRGVAVGVVHIRLPLPMSAQTIVWLAKSRYGSSAEAKTDPAKADPAKADASKGDGKPRAVPGGPGRLVNEWTDAVGREWVEAENDKYHLRAYVVTCGFDAWAVYTGSKRQGVPNPVDLQLAERSMESVVPDPLAPGKGD